MSQHAKKDEKESVAKYRRLEDGVICTLKVAEPSEARFGRTHLAAGEDWSFGDYSPSDFRRLHDKL
jgi:hypothetical protein